MNKELLLLFSTLVFFSYNGFILYKHGVLPSISASYYKLNNKYKLLFTLFVWSFILPVMMVAEVGLMFMGGALVAFVGASPNFMELNHYGEKCVSSNEGEVHQYSAIFGIFLALISLIVDFNLYEPVIGFGLVCFILFLSKVKNIIYWTEMLAFTIVLGSMYYVFIFN